MKQAENENFVFLEVEYNDKNHDNEVKIVACDVKTWARALKNAPRSLEWDETTKLPIQRIGYAIEDTTNGDYLFVRQTGSEFTILKWNEQEDVENVSVKEYGTEKEAAESICSAINYAPDDATLTLNVYLLFDQKTTRFLDSHQVTLLKWRMEYEMPVNYLVLDNEYWVFQTTHESRDNTKDLRALSGENDRNDSDSGDQEEAQIVLRLQANIIK